jgi:hypothetical protein
MNPPMEHTACYQQLIYPRLPASEDKRRVLTPEQIDEIISLFVNKKFYPNVKKELLLLLKI